MILNSSGDVLVKIVEKLSGQHLRTVGCSVPTLKQAMHCTPGMPYF